MQKQEVAEIALNMAWFYDHKMFLISAAIIVLMVVIAAIKTK